MKINELKGAVVNMYFYEHGIAYGYAGCVTESSILVSSDDYCKIENDDLWLDVEDLEEYPKFKFSFDEEKTIEDMALEIAEAVEEAADWDGYRIDNGEIHVDFWNKGEIVASKTVDVNRNPIVVG